MEPGEEASEAEQQEEIPEKNGNRYVPQKRLKTTQFYRLKAPPVKKKESSIKPEEQIPAQLQSIENELQLPKSIKSPAESCARSNYQICIDEDSSQKHSNQKFNQQFLFNRDEIQKQIENSQQQAGSSILSKKDEEALDKMLLDLPKDDTEKMDSDEILQTARNEKSMESNKKQDDQASKRVQQLLPPPKLEKNKSMNNGQPKITVESSDDLGQNPLKLEKQKSMNTTSNNLDYLKIDKSHSDLTSRDSKKKLQQKREDKAQIKESKAEQKIPKLDGFSQQQSLPYCNKFGYGGATLYAQNFLNPFGTS